MRIFKHTEELCSKLTPATQFYSSHFAFTRFFRSVSLLRLSVTEDAHWSGADVQDAETRHYRFRSRTRGGALLHSCVWSDPAFWETDRRPKECGKVPCACAPARVCAHESDLPPSGLLIPPA